METLTPISPLHERIEKLHGQFKSFPQWEDRYKFMIDLGKALPLLPESGRLESFKVKGCQSQVWLFPEFYTANNEQHLRFYGDSDASIVKGLVAVILSIYSEATPAEILATPATFFDNLGLRQHLSMSRANGLNAMLKQIFLYAKVAQMAGKK